MKLLILVRHGERGDDYHIGEKGRLQISALGVNLKRIIDGMKVKILSSSALRAVDSAEILARQFGVKEFMRHDLLWSGTDKKIDPRFPGDEQYQELVELLQADDGCDVVIVVTHLEFTEDFPFYYGMNVLKGVSFPYSEIPNGTAWMIDVVEKTCRHIG
jgi:phosphohistidine phosphatase SixA